MQMISRGLVAELAAALVGEDRSVARIDCEQSELRVRGASDACGVSVRRKRAEPRIPLSRERVLRAAITLADEGGIEALSMRKLAKELGVEAMSLYNHVANKDDVLDGIVDAAWGEIVVAIGETDWKTESVRLRSRPMRRCCATRERPASGCVRSPVPRACDTATRCSDASGTRASRRI